MEQGAWQVGFRYFDGGKTVIAPGALSEKAGFILWISHGCVLGVFWAYHATSQSERLVAFPLKARCAVMADLPSGRTERFTAEETVLHLSVRVCQSVFSSDFYPQIILLCLCRLAVGLWGMAVSYRTPNFYLFIPRCPLFPPSYEWNFDLYSMMILMKQKNEQSEQTYLLNYVYGQNFV